MDNDKPVTTYKIKMIEELRNGHAVTQLARIRYLDDKIDPSQFNGPYDLTTLYLGGWSNAASALDDLREAVRAVEMGPVAVKTINRPDWEILE